MARCEYMNRKTEWPYISRCKENASEIILADNEVFKLCGNHHNLIENGEEANNG